MVFLNQLSSRWGFFSKNPVIEKNQPKYSPLEKNQTANSANTTEFDKYFNLLKKGGVWLS